MELLKFTYSPIWNLPVKGEKESYDYTDMYSGVRRNDGEEPDFFSAFHQ